MGLLGTITLYASIASIIITVISGVMGARTNDPVLVRNAERATYATAIFVTGAVLVLQLALITLDFSLSYVGEYTSSTLSVMYRIGSMWAGQGGSLLLWGWIIALTSAWTVYANKKRSLGMSPWVYVLGAVYGFLFMGMTTFLQSPFAAATDQVVDGMGLNPLLQDPLQLIHPLCLYSGYVLFTVPFAVVCGQLIAGQTEGEEWISYARTWAIASWIMLTIGMVLGARWAYAELGWGGYWAWDPVENASLIPWLTGTALMHTGLSHKGNRGRLRMASLVLLMATFNLALFGTFLTRSGVIQSVHAFGISNLGPVLGGAIVLSVLLCGALIVWRLPQIQYQDEKKHAWGWVGQRLMVSLLVLMTIATLWGTLYPLFARAFRGEEIAVTPGFFKVVVAPMGVFFLVIFAISPLLKNQRTENLQKEAALRFAIFAVVFGAIFMLYGFQNPVVALVLALAALSVKSVIWKAQRPIGTAMRTEGRDKWWNVIHAASPYFGHLGLVILLSAITINVVGEVKEQGKIALNQKATIAGITLRLDDAQVIQYADRQSFQASLSVLDKDGAPTGNIVSMLEKFSTSENLQAQVGILSNLTHDIYVVLDEADATPGAQWVRITVYDNPAINWIWFGGGILGLAGIFYVIPAMPFRRRRREEALAMETLDMELITTVDTALLAVRAGIATTANDRVNSLIASARDLSGGDAASNDQIIAFLERARGSAAPAAPRTGGPSLSRNTIIGAGMGAVIVIAAVAYVAGHATGSSIPGITGTPTSSASANASSGALDQAKIGEYMAAIAKNPNDSTALWNLGNIYFDAQDYKNAQVFYEKLTVASPDDANSWIALGAAAFNQKNDRTAFDAWSRATQVDPKNVEAHYNLGFWYLSQQPSQDLKAKTEWETVVKLAPDSQFAQTVKQHLDQLGSSSASPSPSK